MKCDAEVVVLMGSAHLGILCSVLAQPGIGLSEVIEDMQRAIWSSRLEHYRWRTIHLCAHLQGSCTLQVIATASGSLSIIFPRNVCSVLLPFSSWTALKACLSSPDSNNSTTDSVQL